MRFLGWFCNAAATQPRSGNVGQLGLETAKGAGVTGE
jgi:hypothetical protein